MTIDSMGSTASMVAEVWQCLDCVIDPELDESITTMGFVEKVKIDEDTHCVDVEFRLPTYWCSPNFAFLMALDIRTEVQRLDWVPRVLVKLNDHCFGKRINDGVNGDRDFNQVFSEYCDGQDLSSVRLKFLEKAFVRRQETVLLALEKHSLSRSDIVTMTLETLELVELQDGEAQRQLKRYCTLLLAQNLADNKADLAFVTWAGEALSVEGFNDYLSKSRAVRINMEFNNALCRGLKESRYAEAKICSNKAVPILFVPNATTAGGRKALN